jgi:hypothetical protein
MPVAAPFSSLPLATQVMNSNFLLSSFRHIYLARPLMYEELLLTEQVGVAVT